MQVKTSLAEQTPGSRRHGARKDAWHWCWEQPDGKSRLPRRSRRGAVGQYMTTSSFVLLEISPWLHIQGSSR